MLVSRFIFYSIEIQDLFIGNLQKTKFNLNNFRYENVYHPEDGMDHTEEIIKVCGYCPENYPWLHNPEGNQISGQN